MCVIKWNLCKSTMCHIIIMSHNGSTIKGESIKNVIFCHVLNNDGFPMKGNLIRSNSVLLCMLFRIHRYVEAPLLSPLKTFPNKKMLHIEDLFQQRRPEGQLANTFWFGK